jgi:hypothetical protein
MIKDGVEAQMAIVDTTMVPRDQVLWPAVIMLAGRRCCQLVSETPRVLLPPVECETSDGRTIPHRRM